MESDQNFIINASTTELQEELARILEGETVGNYTRALAKEILRRTKEAEPPKEETK